MCAAGGEQPGVRALVVGLGSPDRGDDAVGPEVAAALARTAAGRGLAGVTVVEHEDPTALVDLLEPTDPTDPTGTWDAVIVIDAVRSGAAPGTLTVLDVGADGQRFAALGARLDPGPAGTHGFGLAGAIELARALDRLPRRVVVVGVEAAGFEHGAPLSDPVRAAIPRAVEVALGVLAAELPHPRTGAGG
jgi:hydrogenase maturation protease